MAEAQDLRNAVGGMLFWSYFNKAVDAREYTGALPDLDTPTATAVIEHGDRWLAIVHVPLLPIVEEEVDRVERLLERATEDNAGEYDGWETGWLPNPSGEQ